MATPPQLPLRVFFDGACPVCSGEIGHYRRRDRDGRLIPVDISAPGFDPHPYGIPLHAFQAELHVIDRDGKIYRGVAGFQAIWMAFPESHAYRLLAAIVDLPLIRQLAKAGYRRFARIRPHLPGRSASGGTELCRREQASHEASKGDER